MTKLANLVSVVLHPLCMPLLTLGLLLATDGYLTHRMALFSYLFVLLLINTLAPAISMFILKKGGIISDWDIRMRRERPWPFLLVFAYYLMAYVLVVKSTAVEVPLFYRNVLLSLVVAIAFAWIVTWKIKISMHMLAQGGIMGVYLHVAMTDQIWSLSWISALILSAGLVGWSRQHLGAHTSGELYLGYVFGVTSVWFTLF